MPPLPKYTTEAISGYGATSEGEAIFFLNIIIKEKTAPPSKVMSVQ